MYYIAYGSNLNKEEMKQRCKDAKFVSLARLENYTLTYRGNPGRAYLNIPWWRSHPIHENRATKSIWTEPCNPLLRATKSTKRATSA